MIKYKVVYIDLIYISSVFEYEVPHLVQTFPVLCGTQRFIAVVTRTRHMSPS